MRLLDQHGATVSLWQFYGLVVVVDFSTMWCAPCQELAGGVEETYQEYRDEGFIYLTVLSEDLDSEVPDQEDLNIWADYYEITAPVLSDDQGYGEQIVGGASGYPLVMVIDRELVVADEQVTPTDDATIRGVVEGLL